MSKILLIAAVEAEIEPFLKESGIGINSWQSFENQQIWISLTGVGVVASTFHIQRLVGELVPDVVIQAGICGAYTDSGLKVGQTVQVVSERLADLGVVDGDRFRNIFPENDVLVNPHRFEGVDYPLAAGFTVNTGSHPCIDQIRSLYPGESVSIETMEGYSLFYCCLLLGVPFMELRTVSNFVSPDRSSWNLLLAVDNLQRGIFDTIKGL